MSEVPGEGFPDLEKVLSLLAAELTEQDLEQLTILIEPEAEDFDTLVERSQLTRTRLCVHIQCVFEILGQTLRVLHIKTKKKGSYKICPEMGRF